MKMTRLQTFVCVSALYAAALFPVSAEASQQVVVVLKTFPSEGRENELLARSLKQMEYFRNA